MPLFSRKERVYPTMTDDQKKKLDELEKIAGFMDTSWVKICGISIGADALIGLIPLVGDVGTSIVAAWVALRCMFCFDPKLRRKFVPMIFNVGIDFLIGTIPLFGDLFDVLFKANVKNINIVRKHYGLERFDGPPAKREVTTATRSAGNGDEANEDANDTENEPVAAS